MTGHAKKNVLKLVHSDFNQVCHFHFCVSEYFSRLQIGIAKILFFSPFYLCLHKKNYKTGLPGFIVSIEIQPVRVKSKAGGRYL